MNISYRLWWLYMWQR